MATRPLVLLIRDGWGIGDGSDGDAVAAARTPQNDKLRQEHPRCVLGASGLDVGLRAGSQGSSEVGHLNMGAGRIVEQEVVRVDKALASGELFENPLFTEAARRCKDGGHAFHLMGLVQDQGVHATQDHLFSILRRLAEAGVSDAVVHFFADGRDTPPRSALTFLDALQAVFDECGIGRVGTVMGRYWAMDRAENWERTEQAYRALLDGQGLKATSAREAIEQAYQRADRQKADGEDIVETDEFIRPTIVVNAEGDPEGLIGAGDAVLHFNYRQDRAIQLAQAFAEADFSAFDRGPAPDVHFMALTRYYDSLDCALIDPMNMNRLLGQVLSEAGLCQLRIAEFQKFRHVTSFFNGKMLQPFAGEDRVQVPSITIPEDQQPEMSAPEVTDLAVTALGNGIAALRAAAEAADGVEFTRGAFETEDAGRTEDTYDVIVLNYANGDMVGHTGVFDAAVAAIETVDECMGRVIDAALARDGVVLVTADHGNAERMADPETGATQTAHTVSDVELIYVAKDSAGRKLRERGILSDIAPTMLEVLGIAKPEEMSAQSLLAEN